MTLMPPESPFSLPSRPARCGRSSWPPARPKPPRQFFPATRLTQGHRREAKGMPVGKPAEPAARRSAVCLVCGAQINTGQRYCAACGVTVSRENLIELAEVGRVVGHSPEARARQAEKKRRHDTEVKAWNPTDKPGWLTEEFYREKIQPRLASTMVPTTASTLELSVPYAAEIRAGRRLPHPRHWLKLARLLGLTPGLRACQA